MVGLEVVLGDLAGESAELDRLVAGLPAADWAKATPAEGWTVAHQIAHLAWTDQASILAATDPGAFAEHLRTAIDNPTGFVDEGAEEGAVMPPDELLLVWREGRDELTKALRAVPPGEKVAWFGPPMSPTSMATARIMETWAHGQDVFEALGVHRDPSERLRHVAHLAVRTRDFAHLLNNRQPPTTEFRVELVAPDRTIWSWGPEDAVQRVTGTALDFCLLATQRRHRDDTDVQAVGPDASAWLDIIQAFAGVPGPGRPKSNTKADTKVDRKAGEDG